MTHHRSHAAIWRWHFYAGLFVLPFVLLLSVTGAIYLFKPQLDRFEERAYRQLDRSGAVSADQQLQAALASYPGAHFNHYRLPEHPGDAAMIQLALPDGRLLEVYVSPQGKTLGAIAPERRYAEIVAEIHGSLLLGRWGDRLVELAASWTIIMVLSGLYLWWPRPFRLAGHFYPRLTLKGRPLLREWHSVTGFWIAGLVLVMLASGLPWAGSWGSGFSWLRSELGWVQGPQEWKIGVQASGAAHLHHHDAPAAPTAPAAASHAAPDTAASGLPLSVFVAKAEAEPLAFPVLVLPPHAPQRFGPPTGEAWTAKSIAQNRWLQQQIRYEPSSGAELGRSGFADQHLVDRIVNTGVAWHEGQLFGLANQLIGLATALALIAISLLGVLMWLRRRPAGGFGAPPPQALPRWAFAVLVVFGLLLPLFGASLLVITLIELLRAQWQRRRHGRAA